MANIGQATFIGSDIIILCDDEWTCCQREQAQAKVDGYNAEIAHPDQPGPMELWAFVRKHLRDTKEACQKKAGGDFLRRMKNASDKKQVATDNSTSDCLGEQIAEKWKDEANLTDLGIDMDHPIEVKFGGPADTALLALDKTINRFFGTAVAKNTGDNMLEAGVEEIEGVSLVCKPPCTPPREEDKNKDYSTGKHATYPENPPNEVSPKYARN
jgi:hypothetical protein